jgi:DNA-binding transcriptional LysR family regulator
MIKASTDLKITSSAVSHSIKALEQDLDCKLFVRKSRSLTLTPSGELLLEKIKPILDQLQVTRSLLETHNKNVVKELRIKTTSSINLFIMPKVIAEYQKQFPNISIIISTSNGIDNTELGEDEIVDYILYPSIEENCSNFDYHIGTDELLLVSHKDNASLIKNKFPKDYSDQTIIFAFDNKSITAQTIFKNLNKKPTSSYIEASDEEQVKRLILHNLGFGILPEWTIRKELESGSLIAQSVNNKKIIRNWIVKKIYTEPSFDHQIAFERMLVENLQNFLV